MHDKINKRRKVCTHKGKKETLSKHCYGVIGKFTNGALRMINNNKYFFSSEPIHVEGKRLSEEVIQAIMNNEAIAETDASVKDEMMEGAYIIEDDHRINRFKSELVSDQWTHDVVIAAEAITTLCLVTTVVRNIGANESGKIKACTDCKIVSYILTLDRTKASQFALDGGGIISKTIQIEKECKIEFEYTHVRTRN